MAELPQFSERSLLARQVVSVSRLPSLLLDTSHHVVAASQSFCVSFRIDPTQITQQSLADIGSGQWDLPQLEALLDRAMNGGPEVGPYEMPFQQADAEPRWLRVSADKIAGRGADEDLVILSIEDITSVKLIADLRETLMREQNKFVYEKNKMTREKNLLLEEMRHRIANSLQIIASILIVKARSVQSAETRRHLTDAHDRVLSIAAIQDQLREGVTTVEVGPYLKKLCASLAMSMIREHRPIDLQVKSDAFELNPHDAVSIGLVVTELVINALKHAFPEGRAGSILVRYGTHEGKCILSVQDDGVGMPRDVAVRHVGLGSSIISALAKQMHAVVETSDSAPGTKVELVSRLPDQPSRIAQDARDLLVS